MIQAQTEDHRHHPIGATLAAVHPGLRHYDEKKATKQSSGEFILRDCGSGYVEELYWSKNVVILSRRHHHNGHAHFVRSFTRKTRILKCMWCTFEGAKWLAIIEKRRGTFIASSDESTPFLEMALPFSVQAAYAAEPECGLVLNAVSAGGNGGPSMFYVKHPMNDIKPIWIDKPLVPLQGTLTHGAHVGGALWLVVSHKGQSTIYQLDSISVAEKASIKTSEMASNVAMETTTTKEAPTPPNTTPQQQPTPKTPQRTRKLSTHSSTPFRTPIRTGQKSTMLHHRPQLNTTPRRQRHSSIVSFQDSFYFSDRTSQYMTQPANQRLLWPSHVARRLTTVSVMPKAKVNGHSDIRKRHFLLIGSDNRLLVVDLANGKVNEVDQVNEFTTLNNYFLVISRDLQSSLYTGMINLGKVNLNEHISTVLGHQSSKRSDIVEKALMASTPVMKRERLFSTPNVPPKAKLKGVFSPGFSPGPVPGYSGQNKAFVTPDLSQRSQKLIVLSHPLNNSVTLAKAKSVRLTLDLDYTNQQTPAIILWRMIEHTVESEHFYKMVGDWLIAKSTGKSTFRHLITFFVDCFVDQGDAEPHLNKKRKSDQIDDCATDLAAAWSPDFLRELGLEAKTMPKLSSEKLDTFYRVLFVVKEELQLSTDYASEAGFISEILPASYRHSPVMRILNATLNQTMTECHRMPMNYRLNPVTCVVVNLYLIVHYGISPSTTRQLVALDVVDFIKSGKTGHFKLNMSPSTNTHMLFELLEHVSSSSWDSLPVPIVAPIRRHLVHLSRQSSLTKTQSLCIRRLLADHHAVLPHPRRHPDHSKIEDGLECLDGRGFTKFIFPEDLRTQSARALLSTYQPLTSSQLGISRHQQHTQLKVEQTFVEMSQRTVAKMFGRALATFSQSTINPVVDRFKEPKADFSLKLEQALIQAGLFSPDLASAGTLSRQELADPWSEWPFYHNSVACGLSLSDGLSLNSSWLIWNKPEKLGTLSYSTVARVAGGLLGICLRGYLELSPLQTILKFTQDRKPLILVSLFLGLCASKKYAGSRNDSLLRLLTIHLPAKFLVNKTEDLLQMTLGIQCAAILALGFLFRNDKREIRHVSNISRYVDLMLDEINKEPDAERDMPNGRESYATAAGFSVGLLLLGAGNDSSLRSLNIVNRLNTLITGGENKTNEASYIMENDQINPWVVKTGAMSATALIFLGTGDRVIASWFDIPASAKLLEAIRPIDLMMMVITKHMILIKHIEPSATWIEQLKPPVIAQNPLSAETLEKWKVRSPAIDYSVTAMADLSINVGAAFVLGLKVTLLLNSRQNFNLTI